MVNVEITNIAPVAFDVAIHNGKRSHAVHVRDDGWALFLKSPTGNSLGKITIPQGQNRRPDIEDAMVWVNQWAESEYGE